MKSMICFFFNVLLCCQLLAQTGFSVSSGTLVRLNNGAYLVLDQMDFENKGTFSDGANSTIKFTGNSDNGIYASLTLELYNLEISKSAGASILLQKNIVVENNLNINQGKLDLNTFNIILDDGQIIGEDATNYITGTSGGYIELMTALNNPDQENPGNLGIEITSIANLGSTTIRRGHEEQTSNNGGKSILRYFDINPVNNSGLNATFRIYYNHADLNSIPEGELEPWRSTDNGDTWELVGGSLLNTTNNWVQLSGVDAFSRWTLASATTSPLPVELSMFKGRAVDNYNLLEWETHSENNVDYFEIQKLEKETWEAIDQVEAAHFTTNTQTYSFKDFDIITLEYYRLRMIDYDEKEEFSEIISVEQESTVDDIFNVYPNPAHDYLTIEFDGKLALDEILIYDYSGKQIRSVKSEIGKINIGDLPAGIYYLEARFAQQFYMKKITKL